MTAEQARRTHTQLQPLHLGNWLMATTKPISALLQTEIANLPDALSVA